jgi:hypothetical protein
MVFSRFYMGNSRERGELTGDKKMEVPTGNLNLASDAFHLWAAHYYKCKNDFKSPSLFSPLPFFLLCRAIELEIKSRHLTHMTQEEVKDRYRHNIEKAYNELNQTEKILSASEKAILQKASKIYNKKNFEYYHPMSLITRYEHFDLESLDSIANKLIRDGHKRNSDL